jgi:small subunit ribosomal protein S6
MPLYESVFIARQDIPAQEVEALTERFQGIVSELGGEIARREYWGLKSLAYRIKKNRKGHYTMLQMDAPSAAIQEMERNMRISEDVLRYMTVRIDAVDEEPSSMMQTRSAREERRREERRSRASSDEATKKTEQSENKSGEDKNSEDKSSENKSNENQSAADAAKTTESEA